MVLTGKTSKEPLDRSLPQAAVVLLPPKGKESKIGQPKSGRKALPKQAAHKKEWWPSSCRGIVG
jgi:hypothetical protein